MNRISVHLCGRFRAVRAFLVRLARAREGVEAIEFAIVLPVLLLFLLGCIEFGRLFWTQSELQYAAEAAARAITISCTGSANVANCSSAANITGTGSGTYAADHVYGIAVPAGAAFAVTNQACGNEVTVCYPFQFIAPGLFPFTNATPPPCPLTPPATGACCPAGYAASKPGLTLVATGCHQA